MKRETATRGSLRAEAPWGERRQLFLPPAEVTVVRQTAIAHTKDPIARSGQRLSSDQPSLKPMHACPEPASEDA